MCSSDLKVEFVDSEIIATVRNTGPIAVDIVMADINDRIYPAAIEPDKHLERFESAIVRIPFEWNEGEPYAVGLTVDRSEDRSVGKEGRVRWSPRQ